MMTSSFPHTHPPINIFFLSLINKAKIRQGLFLLKKNYMLHNNSGSFFQKKNQSLEKFFFPCIFFDHVIIKPLPPTHLVIKHHHLANPPTHLFDDVILECPLMQLFPRTKSRIVQGPLADLIPSSVYGTWYI